MCEIAKLRVCVCVIALTIVYACVCLCHCPILNSFAMYTNHTWRSYHFRIVYEQCMCVWKLAYVLAYISVYVVVVLFAERQNTLANWSHMEQHELIAQVWSDSFIFGNVFKGRLLLLIIRACRVRLWAGIYEYKKKQIALFCANWSQSAIHFV